MTIIHRTDLDFTYDIQIINGRDYICMTPGLIKTLLTKNNLTMNHFNDALTPLSRQTVYKANKTGKMTVKSWNILCEYLTEVNTDEKHN